MKYFETVTQKPDLNLRRKLADLLGMTPRGVQVWFQNKRAKLKKYPELFQSRVPTAQPVVEKSLCSAFHIRAASNPNFYNPNADSKCEKKETRSSLRIVSCPSGQLSIPGRNMTESPENTLIPRKMTMEPPYGHSAVEEFAQSWHMSHNSSNNSNSMERTLTYPPYPQVEHLFNPDKKPTAPISFIGTKSGVVPPSSVNSDDFHNAHGNGKPLPRLNFYRILLFM